MPHQCTGCGHAFEDGSKEMLSGCPECGGNKFQFRPAGGIEGTEPIAESREPDPPDDPTASSVAETVGRATTKVRDFVSSGPNPAPDPNASWPDETSDPVDDGRSDPVDDGRSDPVDDGQNAQTEGDGIIDADARRKAKQKDEREGGEDTAQANARSDVVAPEELDEQSTATLADAADSRDSSSASTSSDFNSDLDSDPSSAPSEGDIVSEPTGEDADLADLREQLNDQFESIKILEPGQYELNLMELYDREEYIIALQENGRYVIQVPEQWIGEDPDDR